MAKAPISLEMETSILGNMLMENLKVLEHILGKMVAFMKGSSKQDLKRGKGNGRSL